MSNARSNATIRSAVEGDIKTIRSLENEWELESSTLGYVASEEAYLFQSLREQFFVAELDAEVVGFVVGTVISEPKLAVVPVGDRYLEIADLYVTQRHRSAGIGAALVARVTSAAKEAGASHLHVFSSSREITRVLEFYTRQGFRPWGVQMVREL